MGLRLKFNLVLLVVFALGDDLLLESLLDAAAVQQVQHPADAPVDAVAVERLEALEELRLALDEGVEVAVGAFDASRDLLELALDGARLREGGPELLDQGVRVIELRLLAQEAELAAAPAGGSAVGLVVARDDTQQRGLPAAVGTDEAHALPVRHVERDVAEDLEPAEGSNDAVCVDHGISGYAVARVPVTTEGAPSEGARG